MQTDDLTETQCPRCRMIWPVTVMVGDLCPTCTDAKAQMLAAARLLSQDFDNQPRYFSPKLHATLGVLLPGITVLAARPSGGKTTFLLNQIVHLVWTQRRSVIYCGMETAPSVFRLQLESLRLGFPWDDVVQNRWDRLPPNARSQLHEALMVQFTETSDRLVVSPVPRLTVADLLAYADEARAREADLLVIDHLHEVDWGARGNDETAAMARGLRQFREKVAEYKLRVLAAAQVRRPGGFDVLEEYLVPPMSAIKQSGAVEEIARMVLMVHRALRADAKEGDLALVRRGQLPVSDVVEPGTMCINVAKARERGSLKGQELRLYVGDSRLYDHASERDEATHWRPILPQEE